MRRPTVLLVVLLAATAASGQWLETTIPMPQPPMSVAWNQANNRVNCAVGYPAEFGAIIVVDGETHEVVDTLMTGYEMPGRVLCDPGHNRVYCAGSSFYPLDDSLVTVVDGSNDSIVAEVQVGSGPMALAYNPGGNKLYCASSAANTVTVIDCNGDTVLAALGVGRCPYDLCYVADVDKVYSANRGCQMQADHTVYAIDGTRNAIICSINVGTFPRSLCYNPQNGKLYCANGWTASVSVIDVAGDTVMATVDVGGAPLAVCWNPANNRVYCTDGDVGSVAVIDGETNALVTTITMDGPAAAVAADSANNKVYCTNSLDGVVTVIDGSADTVLMTIAVGSDPGAMCRRADAGRTYVCNRGGRGVSVLKDSVPGGVEEERMKAESSGGNPSLVRGTLRLGDRIQNAGYRVELLDAAGRRVTDLRQGENDVSRLSPGVYFLRSADSGSRSAVTRKVIIQR